MWHLTAPKTAAPWLPTSRQMSPPCPHDGWSLFHPMQHQPWHWPQSLWGSSVPGSVRNFTSLNLPWLQVLWAAASLMPGPWAGQCSSPWCIGNMNQAGESFPNISAHFWGVSAAPLDCTTLLPVTEQAPSKRIRSQCGERWATSHRQEPWGAGGSGGVHEQKGEHPFWSTAARLQRLLGRQHAGLLS